MVDRPCTRSQDTFERLSAATVAELAQHSRCSTCGDEHPLQLASVNSAGGLLGCLVCGHPELYTQKVFPRPLGWTIVVLAAVLAPVTNYVSLFVAAGLDFVLYFWAGEMLVCYGCHAEHRGFADDPRHPRFDRTIEERLKYGERAVMGSPMRAGGTAGAPDPEH